MVVAGSKFASPTRAEGKVWAGPLERAPYAFFAPRLYQEAWQKFRLLQGCPVA